MIDGFIMFLIGAYFSWYFVGFAGAALLHGTSKSDPGVFPIVMMILLSISIYVQADISPFSYYAIGAVYLPIGMLWSLHKWKHYCASALVQARKRADSYWDSHKSYEYVFSKYRAKVSPSGNALTILTWVLAWPFSLIATVGGRGFKLLVDLFKNYLSSLYGQISESHIASLDEHVEEYKANTGPLGGDTKKKEPKLCVCNPG